jgi:periplasmic protein CpxP/Spy
MDTTKKYKALVSIIIFLLITNFAMLLFFMVLSKPAEEKPRNHEQNGFYTLLQKEVGFSQSQLGQYQDLRTQQRKNVSPLFNEVKKAKEDFYELLYSDNVSDSLINADADSIAQAQRKLDMQMFRHFKMVRNICTPEQIQKFDSSMKKVIVRMTSRPGRGKPNNNQDSKN